MSESSLVLIKEDQSHLVYSHDEDIPTSVNVQRIVGLVPGDGGTVMEYGHELSGNEYEDELHLSTAALERIVEFYEQTRARPHSRTFYNCHVFAGYVAGKIFKLPTRRYWWSGWDEQSAEPTTLTSGEGYAIKGRDESRIHSMLGIKQPEMNLSVLGDRQPLVMSRANDLLAAYAGTKIVHLIP